MVAKGPRARTQMQGYDRWNQGEGNARTRIEGGLVVPEPQISFAASPEAKVFLIGAGFARRLEVILAKAGVRMTSRPQPGDPEELRTSLTRGVSHLYVPGQIQQELSWAAGQPFPLESLLPVGDQWSDPFLDARAAVDTLPKIRERRKRISAHYARAFQSDIVVVTLSHTEAWFDRRTKMMLSGAPHPLPREADRERFGMKRLSFDDVVTSLKGICRVIRRQNDKAHIVLAVSPVPIPRTYGQEDVIVANMISKSTLHAAATAVAAGNDRIDYFPAFEAVMTSEPGRAFLADRRSVSVEMLRALADAFTRRYELLLSAETETLGNA